MTSLSLMAAVLLAAAPASEPAPKKPEVHGSLERGEIQSVIKGSSTRMRRCYEEALKVKPELSGKVAVSFTIAATGRVLHAEMAEDTMHEPMISDCLIAVFKRLVFPAPKGGGVVNVTYPFVFKQPKL